MMNDEKDIREFNRFKKGGRAKREENAGGEGKVFWRRASVFQWTWWGREEGRGKRNNGSYKKRGINR